MLEGAQEILMKSLLIHTDELYKKKIKKNYKAEPWVCACACECVRRGV